MKSFIHYFGPSLFLLVVFAAADWATSFNDCRTAPGIPAKPACQMFDLDGDGDVDQTDFGLAQVRPHFNEQIAMYVIFVPANLEHDINPDRYLAKLFMQRAGLQ